jgi:hypothetical protein
MAACSFKGSTYKTLVQTGFETVVECKTKLKKNEKRLKYKYK